MNQEPIIQLLANVNNIEYVTYIDLVHFVNQKKKEYAYCNLILKYHIGWWSLPAIWFLKTFRLCKNKVSWYMAETSGCCSLDWASKNAELHWHNMERCHTTLSRKHPIIKESWNAENMNSLKENKSKLSEV